MTGSKQLIVLEGPSPSGKTTWAREKAREEGWMIASDFRQAAYWLERGFNVVLDPDMPVKVETRVIHFERR